MKVIFQGRRQVFLQRCMKYSRYVFNDHFVLVLLVLLGFLSLQYRQLLISLPTPVWPVYLLLVACTVLLFFAGNIATYVEEADQYFMLAKEEEIFELVQQAGRRQLLVWGSAQLLGQLLLLPLYLKLGFSLLGFVGYLLILTIGKWGLSQWKLSPYQVAKSFQWGYAIDQEKKRKQMILQFFALFTQVKGITTSVKRRSYLDFLLKLVSKRPEKTWDYLYFRAFLRSGDFLALTIRLLVLSLVALLAVDVEWLAVSLLLLFDYLLLFQLFSLYSVFDYQYMNRLYPLDKNNKRKGFKRILQGIVGSVIGVQLCVSLLVFADKQYLGVLLLGGLILNTIYLGIKAKKLID